MGPVVELKDGLVHLLMADPAQVGALGKVLAQQAVGVFIEAALPG